MLTGPTRLCRPCLPAEPAHAAATAGFSIPQGEIPGETDCLLERNGFELPVRGRGQSDCRPFGLRLAALGFAGRANSPHDSLPERDGVELLVPCRKKNESRSGTGTETVTKVTKVRLEAVVYLPDTDASKPSPSSRESANRHRLGP